MTGHTVLDGPLRSPFRFTEQGTRHAKEGYVYVLHISSGAVKVGYTAWPQTRINTHVATAQIYGATIDRAWISAPHVGARENERALLAYCRSRSAVEHGGEHFSGLNFSDVIVTAESLPFWRALPNEFHVTCSPKAVRALREVHGWSMRELAERAGITPGFVSKLERGLIGTSPPMTLRLATALNVSMGAIVDAEGFLSSAIGKIQRRQHPTAAGLLPGGDALASAPVGRVDGPGANSPVLISP